MPTLLHASRRCVAMVIALLGCLVCLGQAAETFSPARLAVYFSPNGGATDAVVREVSAAQQQILVQAYSFTSAPIAKALVEAHKRGVKILAVLDKSKERSCTCQPLARRHAIAAGSWLRANSAEETAACAASA